MIDTKRTRLAALAMASLFAVGACGGAATPAPTSAPTSAPPGATPTPTAQPLSGEIRIDGSSTVYPISEAVAEEFQKANPGVRVTVAFSGTGGGFKKFCADETEANDASRPIKTEDKPDAKSEATTCAENGVTPVELSVAYDGLSVMVNPENDFVSCLTVDELKRIWDQESTVRTWADVRPEWPAEEIHLYGPGADSGTFDYFTEEINGEAKRSRSDYTQSEDDNALVQGIAGDRNALGYFGYAYYVENRDVLKAVAVDGGAGCVGPSDETINDGSYAPLSRPLFVYPSKEALARPEVGAFFRYYLENASAFASEVGYIPLPDDLLAASAAALEEAIP